MERKIIAFVILTITTSLLPTSQACNESNVPSDCYESTESGDLGVTPDIDPPNLEVSVTITTPDSGHKISTDCIL